MNNNHIFAPFPPYPFLLNQWSQIAQNYQYHQLFAAGQQAMQIDRNVLQPPNTPFNPSPPPLQNALQNPTPLPTPSSSEQSTTTSDTVDAPTTVPDGPIEVKLANEKLWEEFDKLPGGNEMVVLVSGRDLFPRLVFSVKNLKTSGHYKIGLKLKRINERYTRHTQRDGWYTSAEPVHQRIPPESKEIVTVVQDGEWFMENGIDFGKVKVYNVRNRTEYKNIEQENQNAMEADGSRKRKTDEENSFAKRRKKGLDPDSLLQVFTQCDYKPVITVYECDQSDTSIQRVVGEFQFDVAKFHVVTVYKNDRITKLKCMRNTHVRGDVRTKMVKKAIESGETRIELTMTSSKNASKMIVKLSKTIEPSTTTRKPPIDTEKSQVSPEGPHTSSDSLYSSEALSGASTSTTLSPEACQVVSDLSPSSGHLSASPETQMGPRSTPEASVTPPTHTAEGIQNPEDVPNLYNPTVARPEAPWSPVHSPLPQSLEALFQAPLGYHPDPWMTLDQLKAIKNSPFSSDASWESACSTPEASISPWDTMVESEASPQTPEPSTLSEDAPESSMDSGISREADFGRNVEQEDLLTVNCYDAQLSNL